MMTRYGDLIPFKKPSGSRGHKSNEETEMEGLTSGPILTMVMILVPYAGVFPYNF